MSKKQGWAAVAAGVVFVLGIWSQPWGPAWLGHAIYVAAFGVFVFGVYMIAFHAH